jgi:hypothetical protein
MKALVQALLEVMDSSLSERVRPYDEQKLINSLSKERPAE